MAQSRLDRVHASPHLVDKIATTSHKAGISDHCRVEVAFNMGLFNYYVSHLGGGGGSATLSPGTIHPLSTSL